MIIDISGPPEGTATSLSDCERALEPTFRLMLAELAHQLGSPRRAAEELAGGIMLPSEYTLVASWLDMLRACAQATGWDSTTVEKALPSLAARVTIPVFKVPTNMPPGPATRRDAAPSRAGSRFH